MVAAGKNRALLLQVKKKKKRERGFPSAPRRLAPHEAWRRAPNQYPRPPLVPPCMSHPDLLPSFFSVSWTSIAQFPAPVCVGWLPWPVTSGSVRDFFFFFSGHKQRGEVSHRPEDGAWRRRLCQGLTSSRHPLVDRFVDGHRAERTRPRRLGRACAGEAASLESARTPARSCKSRRPEQKKEALKKRAILHQKKP